jgi:hypothetical protein
VVGLTALLAGWAALAIVNVAWLLVALWPMDAAQTRAHATTEDPGRTLARTIALTGSLVSLVAVAVLIHSRDDSRRRRSRRASRSSRSRRRGRSSRSTTCCATRTASTRGETGLNGGIDFNQDDDPMY